jgi:hypothetical protein
VNSLSLADKRNDRFWPIVLKKSVMVSTAEKYASEIEIFTFGRGFQTRISRSSVEKWRSHCSMSRPFWMSDFFNTIGRKQSVIQINIDHRLACPLRF